MTGRLGAWVADDFEVVAELTGPMPTGVTVSDTGRIFVSFPRWGDDVSITVAEIVEGAPVAFPSADINAFNPETAATQLVSVQSVVIDPAGDLWLLDTGSIELGPVLAGGPKLVQVDLATDSVVRVIPLTGDSITATSFLNDVRFDLSRGKAGYAYLTDAQAIGGLIVVDLDSGRSWPRLRGHSTTQAVDQFRAVIQGVVREGYKVGADGIALNPDGTRLYYCPLSSRRLYSVDTAALVDGDLDDDDVAQTVVDHGDKGASDGLECDTDGAVYATAYEHSAVLKRTADGSWETVLHGGDLLWPDTLALSGDGYLYLSVNQLPRMPMFNRGVDDRVPPYLIVRTQIGVQPVRLAKGHQ